MCGAENTGDTIPVGGSAGEPATLPSATAIAHRLDDDPAVDKWQIDETGELRVVIDDSIDR